MYFLKHYKCQYHLDCLDKRGLSRMTLIKLTMPDKRQSFGGPNQLYLSTNQLSYYGITYFPYITMFLPIAHGGLSEWSEWGACDSPCGFGRTTRTRQCNKPVPANGGDDCEGSLKQRKGCKSARPCGKSSFFAFICHFKQVNASLSLSSLSLSSSSLR